MKNESEVLGFVLCKTCNQPKSVKQGKGKRINFVNARCICGLDTRTGKSAQAELKAFKPLVEIEAEIALKNKPLDKHNIVNVIDNIKDNTEMVKDVQKPVEKTGGMSTSASVGVGVVVGLFFGGLIKLVKVAT